MVGGAAALARRMLPLPVVAAMTIEPLPLDVSTPDASADGTVHEYEDAIEVLGSHPKLFAGSDGALP